MKIEPVFSITTALFHDFAEGLPLHVRHHARVLNDQLTRLLTN